MPRWNLDEEYATKARAEMLGWADRFLRGQANVVQIARILAPYAHVVDLRTREILVVFVGIDSETDDLPLGDVRSQWNSDALARADMLLAESGRLYRDKAAIACRQLIDALCGAAAWHRIRQIIFNDWNPIGVQLSSEAISEYESLVPVIYEFTQRSGSQKELAQYISQFESEKWELSGDVSRAKRVAELLWPVTRIETAKDAP